jgi:hypothetical protein
MLNVVNCALLGWAMAPANKNSAPLCLKKK